MLSIEHITYFMPQTIVRLNTDYSTIGISKLQSKIFTTYFGLDKLHVDKDLTSAEFSLKPLEKLIDETQIDLETIKYLIYAHITCYSSPYGLTINNIIRNKLGLKSTEIFSMTMNKCASMLDALHIASFLLKGMDENSKLIILAADKVFTPEYRTTGDSYIAGDGAASVLVNNSGKRDTLIALSRKTFGKYAKGGWMNSEEGVSFENEFIFMISSVVNDALFKANLTFSDIKVVLPHNVNVPVWEKIAKNFSVPFSKIYTKNIQLNSHCFCADFLLNHESMQSENILEEGDYYLVINLGYGVTFSAAIFQY